MTIKTKLLQWRIKAMTREEVYSKINEVFQNVFDNEDITVNDTTTSDDIEDWDSLEQINLVVAVEKKFNIKFNMREVNKFKNVGEMVDIIMTRL
jgi:acyl carrier protein